VRKNLSFFLFFLLPRLLLLLLLLQLLFSLSFFFFFFFFFHDIIVFSEIKCTNKHPKKTTYKGRDRTRLRSISTRGSKILSGSLRSLGLRRWVPAQLRCVVRTAGCATRDPRSGAVLGMRTAAAVYGSNSGRCTSPCGLPHARGRSRRTCETTPHNHRTRSWLPGRHSGHGKLRLAQKRRKGREMKGRKVLG